MRYVQPSVALLKDISAERNGDISLDVYCSDQRLLRDFFWFRLALMSRLMKRLRPHPGRCLDFGGGSGVFAASLSTGFAEVTLIDRNTDEAALLIERLGLGNVNVVNADIASFDFGPERFDAITAADVLEHFQSLSLPLSRIARWLKKDGLLITSLPTENAWYRLLRLAFGKTKPHDHYHSAAHVERALKAAGFEKVAGLYHPLWVPVLPLFRVSAWRKSA